MIIKGYQDANLKADQTVKQLNIEIANLKKELTRSKKQTHELEIKALV